MVRVATPASRDHVATPITRFTTAASTARSRWLVQANGSTVTSAVARTISHPKKRLGRGVETTSRASTAAARIAKIAPSIANAAVCEPVLNRSGGGTMSWSKIPSMTTTPTSPMSAATRAVARAPAT